MYVCHVAYITKQGNIMKYLVIQKITYTFASDSYNVHYSDGFDTLELANEYAELQVKLEKSKDTTYTVVPFGNVE